MNGEDPRKRRDSLDDQLGAPLYSPAPEPPYISLVEGMIFACFTFDRARARPHLPPGLTPIDENTALFVVVPHGRMGWGLQGASLIFPAVMVQELPSPDTAEACYIPGGLIDGDALPWMQHHYGDFAPGSSLVSRTRDAAGNDLVVGEIRCGGSLAVRVTIRPHGPLRDDMASTDRYFMRAPEGGLHSFVVSASGSCHAADLLELEFTQHAPPAWQALQPVALNWALHIPMMLANWSAPTPYLPDPPDARASRAALFDILDRQGRACAILSGEGRVLHRNASAARLVPQAMLHLGPDQMRFLGALAAAARGGAGATGAPFLLDRSEGRLILQLAPLDPALAGPDTVLALIDTPRADPRAPRAEVLQLLGLTPAEARIAAAVGSGLPPREAAARLGLAESTVRSSLKVIFDKLGVKRQAELVQIVARLEAR